MLTLLPSVELLSRIPQPFFNGNRCYSLPKKDNAKINLICLVIFKVLASCFDNVIKLDLRSVVHCSFPI